jgi:hypothetical protein
VRLGVLLLVVVALVGCGASKPSAESRANVALLDRAPVYPGATAPKTTPGDAFAARDWTLSKDVVASRVIDWYIAKLQARGWKVSGKSFATIRAKHGNASLSVGVRARTLEVVAAA